MPAGVDLVISLTLTTVKLILKIYYQTWLRLKAKAYQDVLFKGCVCFTLPESCHIQCSAKILHKIKFPADEQLGGIDSHHVPINRFHHGNPLKKGCWATRQCNKTDEMLSPDGEKMFRRGCFRTYQHESVFHGHTNRKKGLLGWHGLVPLPGCSPPLTRAL